MKLSTRAPQNFGGTLEQTALLHCLQLRCRGTQGQVQVLSFRAGTIFDVCCMSNTVQNTAL